MSVVLQPTGNRDSRIHYSDTVDNPVDLEAVSTFLGGESTELHLLYPNGKAQMWGVTPGKSDVNVPEYSKLEVGDAVLFLRDKQAFARARISLLFHNPSLAKHLWGRDENDMTWEYMYALRDVEDIRIPYVDLQAAGGYKSGYNFRAFRVVSGDKAARIHALFGELEQDPAEAPWDIQIGETLARTALHDRYGGARRGGIEPSAITPNVFLFSDPTVGSEFGYDFDGPGPDDDYFFTGDGQVGNQDPETGGNKSLLDAEAKNRAIRMFTKKRTYVTYLGEYELADQPYEIRQAPDKNKVDRDVLVFHLLPVDVDPEPTLTGELQPTFVPTPVEKNITLHFDQKPQSLGRRSTRKEAVLQNEYVEWCSQRGHELSGGAIRMALRKSDLKIDLFKASIPQVIEVKSSASRIHIRQAIGQVLEYAFLMSRDLGTSVTPAILTPHRPTQDLCDLLMSLGITFIWQAGDTFEESNGRGHVPIEFPQPKTAGRPE